MKEFIVPFTSGDGFKCNLIHVTGNKTPDKGPLMLVHGAGVRSNIFRAPVETNIVDSLLEEGYDVWMENWRGSIDFEPNNWTLDQVALYDHPAAVKTVLRETGAAEMNAIIHCQGSTSFTMSAIAGLVPEVKTIISNAVSLQVSLPRWSKLKLKLFLPVLHKMLDYLNPQWGIKTNGLASRLVDMLVMATHHECDNDVCKHVSFTYGSGFPALWEHENLNEETHEWLKHEFAEVPLTFFDQILKSAKKGNLVSVDGNPVLPADFAAQPPDTSARFSFFAGIKNKCFLCDSQVRAFEYFNRIRPGYHTLHLLPDYSHLDVFMGKNAARDVFPLMIKELNKQAD